MITSGAARGTNQTTPTIVAETDLVDTRQQPLTSSISQAEGPYLCRHEAMHCENQLTRSALQGKARYRNVLAKLPAFNGPRQRVGYSEYLGNLLTTKIEPTAAIVISLTE